MFMSRKDICLYTHTHLYVCVFQSSLIDIKRCLWDPVGLKTINLLCFVYIDKSVVKEICMFVREIKDKSKYGVFTRNSKYSKNKEKQYFLWRTTKGGHS